VDVFEKLLRENNLDHKSSRLSIRWLNSTPRIQPATNFTHKHPATLQSQHTTVASSEPNPEPGLQGVLHNRGTKMDSDLQNSPDKSENRRRSSGETATGDTCCKMSPTQALS
jgi:hypothetical protein